MYDVTKGKIPVKVYDNKQQAFEAMADMMVETIVANNKAGKKTLFIVPVGPVGQYPYFVETEDIAGYRFYCNGQLYQQELIKAQRISIPMPSTSDVFTVAAVYVDGVESEMSNEVSWSTSDIFELEEAPEVYVENRTLYVNSDYNSIKVYNISGMLEGEYYFGETSIDLSDLNSGVYVIVVENNNGTRTQKVILQ